MQVDAKDLIAATESQLHAALREAAMLKAALDGAGRENEALKAELAKPKNRKVAGA